MIEKIQIQAFERFLFVIFRFFFFFLLVLFVIRFFFVSPGVVNGPSMEPTFIDEDLFFVNRFIYLVTSPKRQDVVQVIDKENNKLIIKRIIGMPGETVVIKRGKVFITPPGGEEYELSEPYLVPDTYTDVALRSIDRIFVIPEHSYFVLGDNRNRSTDSRYYGSIDRTGIVGRVIRLSKKK